MTIKRWLKTPKNLLNRWLNPVPPQIIYSFRFVLRVSLKLFLTEIFFSQIYLHLSANQPKVESHIIAKLSLVFAQEAVLSPHSAPAALRIHGKELAMQRNIRSEARRRRVSASQSPSAFDCSSVTIVEKTPAFASS